MYNLFVKLYSDLSDKVKHEFYLNALKFERHQVDVVNAKDYPQNLRTKTSMTRE